MVGRGGVEPPTSRLSGVRSNHLSYRPGAHASRFLQQREALESLPGRSEEHTSELQSLMRISYAVFCLKKKKRTIDKKHTLVYLHTPRSDNNLNDITTKIILR